MAPTLSGKSKTELHIECCLLKDIEAALLDFLNGDDISFTRFKTVWRTSKMGLIPSAAVKERVDQSVYIQIVFYVILSLLDRPVVPTGTSQEHRLLLLNNEADRTCLWNIGVLYCLYAMYHTQERTIATSIRPMMQPINIGPGTALVLMKTAEQCIAVEEFGASALGLYKKLWRDGAFRCCAYNGPSSVFYSQRAACSGGSLSQSAVTVTDVPGASSASTSSSSSSAASDRATSDRASPITMLHNIRQHYNIPNAAVQAPPAAAPVPITMVQVDASHIFAVCAPAPVTVAASITHNIEAMYITEEASSRAPKLPEMLAQSIPVRRQMKAVMEQHRKDLAQAAVDRKKEKLKKKWLKRVEVTVPDPGAEVTPSRSSRRIRGHDHDAVEEPATEGRSSARAATSDTSTTSPATTTRQRSVTKRTYVLQSELPAETSSRVQSVAKLSLEAAFPTRAPAPRLEPSSRRSRSSAAVDGANKKELPARAKASSSRRFAAKSAPEDDSGSADGSDNEQGGLIDSFEEFVGLRAPSKPKPPAVSARVTRNSRPASGPTTSAKASSSSAGSTAPVTADKGSSTTRRRPAAQASGAPNVTWAPRLDAETGDIMEILSRLEAESAAVLQGGVATRSRRSASSGSDTLVTDLTEAEPANKRARKAATTMSGASTETSSTTAQRNAPPAALTSAASSAGPFNQATKSNGKGKAAKPTKKPAAAKNAHMQERRIVRRKFPPGRVGRGCVSDDSADEAPAPGPVSSAASSAASSEIMDMLQRLEQESQQILQRAPSSSSVAAAGASKRPAAAEPAVHRVAGNKRARSAAAISPEPPKSAKVQKKNRAPSATARVGGDAGHTGGASDPAHAEAAADSSAPLPRVKSRRSNLAARAISLPPVVVPVAVEAPSAGSGGSDDIMSLLGRLEQESNEVLQRQSGGSDDIDGANVRTNAVTGAAPSQMTRKRKQTNGQISSVVDMVAVSPSTTVAEVVVKSTVTTASGGDASKSSGRSSRHSAGTSTVPSTATVAAAATITPTVTASPALAKKSAATKKKASDKQSAQQAADVLSPAAPPLLLSSGTAGDSCETQGGLNAVVSEGASSADPVDIMDLLAQLEQQSSVILRKK